MTQIKTWLQTAQKQLQAAGVDAPQTDCLVLLEDVFGRDRSWIIAHDDTTVQTEQLHTLETSLHRRLQREPLAYIRGKAWFYGREFIVNRHVLIPRPESESFISLLKDLQPAAIIDIGTGSGVLAITAALEIPHAHVAASDMSAPALAVAQQNIDALDVSVHLTQASLLEHSMHEDLRRTTIVANLPYVPDDLVTSAEISHEPAEALFSGSDGLEHYRKLWQHIAQHTQPPAHVMTEALETQHDAITALAATASYKLVATDLLVQHFTRQH